MDNVSVVIVYYLVWKCAASVIQRRQFYRYQSRGRDVLLTRALREGAHNNFHRPIDKYYHRMKKKKKTPNSGRPLVKFTGENGGFFYVGKKNRIMMILYTIRWFVFPDVGH